VESIHFDMLHGVSRTVSRVLGASVCWRVGETGCEELSGFFDPEPVYNLAQS
jgi:hypothetical protein